MKNIYLKNEIALLLIAAIPLAYLAYVFNSLPDSIPTHFGFDGKPNDYSSKGAIVYLLGVMSLGIYLLMLVLPLIDPKKNIQNNQSVFLKIRFLVQILIAGISFFVLRSAQTQTAHVSDLFAIMGAFFALMGNYMQAVKPNYFVGIRTPWTLQSDTVWAKTHRTGGRLWFWGGLVIVPMALFLPAHLKTIAIITLLGILVIVPVVYSYILFRRENKEA